VGESPPHFFAMKVRDTEKDYNKRMYLEQQNIFCHEKLPEIFLHSILGAPKKYRYDVF
jgi:hypothetical protein